MTGKGKKDKNREKGVVRNMEKSRGKKSITWKREKRIQKWGIGKRKIMGKNGSPTP